MAHFLDRFDKEDRQFIKERFITAYVFNSQTYNGATRDEISLAKSPKELKRRLKANLEELQELQPSTRGVAQQIISSFDGDRVPDEEFNSFLYEVRTEIDSCWALAGRYRKLHPPKERKPVIPPTPKQVAMLRSLGCEDTPNSKSHASKLIERYLNHG